MSEEEDPSGELIRQCENEPEAGLAWIARLDENLRAKPRIRFASFLAYRAILFGKLVEQGMSGLPPGDPSQHSKFFSDRELDAAERALEVISEIEQNDPSYLPDLQFPNEMIDQVATVLTSFRPGRAQQILGWTKIKYFDSSRIFIPKPVEELCGPLPKSLSSAALNARWQPEATAKSVMFGDWNANAGTVRVMFMRENVRDYSTVADAGPMNLMTLDSGTAPPKVESKTEKQGCAVFLLPLIPAGAALILAIGK